MASSTPRENQLYRYHAEMCRVFSHPTRLEILDTLREVEMTVSDLAQRMDLGMANLSQHLALMREQRILLTRKEGNTVFYRIARPKILQAFDLLREILRERMAEDQALIQEVTP